MVRVRVRVEVMASVRARASGSQWFGEPCPSEATVWLLLGVPEASDASGGLYLGEPNLLDPIQSVRYIDPIQSVRYKCVASILPQLHI